MLFKVGVMLLWAGFEEGIAVCGGWTKSLTTEGHLGDGDMPMLLLLASLRGEPLRREAELIACLKVTGAPARLSCAASLHCLKQESHVYAHHRP